MNWLHNLAEALRFLTLLPVPGRPAMDERALVRSMPLFPLAGAIIGALVALCWWGALTLWGPLVGAVCAVLSWGAITSGLHLDGVADSADALFSWRSRERKLEIMKDSRIGTMGALALFGVLALKIAFVASSATPWRALIAAATLGRWADISGIYWFPAAAEGGLGRTFHTHTRPRDLWIASGWALLLGLGLLGWWMLLVGLVVLGGTWLLASWMTRALGGLTGDTYGTLCELGEVLALAACAAITHLGGQLGW